MWPQTLMAESGNNTAVAVDDAVEEAVDRELTSSAWPGAIFRIACFDNPSTLTLALLLQCNIFDLVAILPFSAAPAEFDDEGGKDFH